MLYSILCRARQLLRRQLWLLAFVAGLFLYPAQVRYTEQRAASEARAAAAAGALKAFPFKNNAEAYAALTAVDDAGKQAAADTRAQQVAPDYLRSKMSIAVGVFCLIMGLAWTALQLVIPVIPNWATGDYVDPERAAAVGLDAPVVGFKRSFLRQSDLARVCLLLGFMSLLVVAAGLGVWAAFTIQ